jgi:RNA polymerase sigma factor (sigma-70 family)
LLFHPHLKNRRKKMESLTEKVLQYQKTRQGLRDLVDELAPRVYQFPRRKMGWDEDACGDFYLFVHPRLIRLLDRFRDQGKPFESYLCAVLNWQLRNFARDRSRGKTNWNVSLRLEDREDDEAEPSPQPLLSPEIAAAIRSDADRRNFLFLVLKCSRTLDLENTQVLAPLAGVSREKLLTLASTVQGLRTSRERRLETFRSRRNKAFALIRVLETELMTEGEPQRVLVLQGRLARARRRMRSAMQRMARVGLAPTNKEIGAVLGVPKGTVDSGLYWLKRKLASVYDPDNLRLA